LRSLGEHRGSPSGDGKVTEREGEDTEGSPNGDGEDTEGAFGEREAERSRGDIVFLSLTQRARRHREVA
jgi:hypothetical protein